MPKLWQFPDRAEALLAEPQPIAPGAGFESVAPDRVRTRRVAQVGNNVETFTYPPAPPPLPTGFDVVAPERVKSRSIAKVASFQPDNKPPFPPLTNGWEAFFPPKLPRRPTDAGAVFRPDNKPPADTASSPLGFPAISPEKMPKRPTDRGATLAEMPLDRPPPATAANPIGWRIDAPEKMRKRPTDAGSHEQLLLALAQPIPPNGWDVLAPVKLPRRPAGPGTTEWTLFQPPAATSANPLGWEPLFPWRLRAARAAQAFADSPLAQPAASSATNPLGWECLGPWILRRRPTDAGTADLQLDRLSAPLVMNPLGWEPVSPASIRSGRKPPTFDDTPLNLPPLPTPANAGWASVMPWWAKRRPIDAGTAFYPVRQPDAATNDNPIGWRIESPDRMRRPRWVAGTEYAPPVDVPIAVVVPLFAWHEVPAVSRKPRFVSGSAETSLLAPGRPVEGWPTVSPERMRTAPRRDGAVDLAWVSPPAISFTTAEFPHVMRRKCPGNGSTEFRIVLAATPVLGWATATPDRMRRRPMDFGTYFAIWRALSNPASVGRRIVLRETSVTRIVLPGIVSRRLEVPGRVVRRKTP